MSDITNKEILLRLMDDMKAVRDTMTTHTEALKTISNHTALTNGEIAKAKKEIALLEIKIQEGDSENFRRFIRYGGIALLLSSFIFIKESRDVIIQLLNTIL